MLRKPFKTFDAGCERLLGIRITFSRIICVNLMLVPAYIYVDLIYNTEEIFIFYTKLNLYYSIKIFWIANYEKKGSFSSYSKIVKIY